MDEDGGTERATRALTAERLMERSIKLKRRRWRHGGTHSIMFGERMTFTYLLAFVRPLLLFRWWAERFKGV